MRFILSVQQNDQIATIHMGVVDVVTGAEFRLFFHGEIPADCSSKVRPHTGQETANRRAHREHD